MDNVQNHKQYDDDESVIDLPRLFKALWRSAWSIVAIALLFGSLTYLGTKTLITPTYRAGFTAYVNNRNNSGEDTTIVTSSDLTASRSLVYTYSEIITSRTLLQEAAEQAGIAADSVNLSECVTTAIVSDTEIITVYAIMEDPDQATELIKAIAFLAPEYISRIVEGTSMQIIDAPARPTDIYSPSYLKNTLIGLFLGGLLSGGIVVLRELLDDRVKGEEELESRFGIAVVGAIPNLEAAGKIDSSYGYGGTPASEKGSAQQ